MPDTKTSVMSSLTGANLADADLFEVVDVSDTSMAATGTNKSLTGTELASGVGRLDPRRLFPLAVSKLFAVGHSYLAGGVVTHADRQYVTSLAGMLRADVIDIAVGGAEIANDEAWGGATNGKGGWAYVLQSVVPFRGTSPYEPEDFFPLVHFGINDVLQHSHDGTGNPRTIFKTALRTVLSRLSAARLFEDTDGSVVFGGSGGTWQTVLDMRRNSGSSYRPIPGNGATFTITLPADFEGGSIAIGLIAWPAGDGQITWTGTASQLPATTSLAGLAYAAGGSAARRDSSNGHVVRVTGLIASDASKTIIGTYGSGAGTAVSTPTQQGVITQGGTAGSTTYGYKRVYRMYNGDTIASTARTTAAGNATLNGTNYNIIPAGPAFPAGVEYELILRSTGGGSGGGATTGLIAVLTAPAAVNDTGISAQAYTVPGASPLTGGAAFDYWQIEATNPVTRGVVVNVNRVLSYVNSATDTDVNNYNADIASVVAEFAAGQWIVSDVDTALNKTASLFWTDGVHPNDRGHGVIAGTVFTSMQSVVNGLALTDVVSQSRVSKRITSRRLVNQVFADALLVGVNPGQYVKSNGTIAAGSLPFTGTGTADYTLDATARLLDTSNLVMQIDALPGDDIEVELSALYAATANVALLDVAFLDGSNNVLRYFSALPYSPTTFGINGHPGWYAPNEAITRPITGKAVATVTAAEVITFGLVPGVVSVTLVGKTASGSRVLFGGGGIFSSPLVMHVKNVGRRNGSYNAS